MKAEGMQVETMTGEYPVVEVMKLGRFRVEVCQEQDAEFFNPREWSNLGQLVADSDTSVTDYLLGYDAEVSMERALEDECPDCEGDGWATDIPGDPTECGRCEGSGAIPIKPFAYFQREYGATVVVPLQFGDYGSSGSRLYVGRPMGPDDEHDDSDNLYLFDTPATRKEMGCEDWSAERVAESLVDEAGVFKQWVEDECYCIVSYGADGEIVESLGGYLGYDDTLEEAESQLRALYDDYVDEGRKVLDWARDMGRALPDTWITTGVAV